MKLKAIISFAGKEVSAIPGQEFDCPNDIAADLIKCGYAKKAGRTTPKGALKDEG